MYVVSCLASQLPDGYNETDSSQCGRERTDRMNAYDYRSQAQRTNKNSKGD
jgi:hypothetical protein